MADWENGLIPEEELFRLPGMGLGLTNEAAAAYLQMVEAARADGVVWGVTESYRTLQTQLDAYNSPKRAMMAQPKFDEAGKAHGTSEHGWGMALDLRLNPDIPMLKDRRLQHGDQANDWLKEHAAEFGFRTLMSKDEPWHWQFTGSPTDVAANRGQKAALALRLDPNFILPKSGTPVPPKSIPAKEPPKVAPAPVTASPGLRAPKPAMPSAAINAFRYPSAPRPATASARLREIHTQVITNQERARVAAIAKTGGLDRLIDRASLTAMSPDDFPIDGGLGAVIGKFFPITLKDGSTYSTATGTVTAKSNRAGVIEAGNIDLNARQPVRNKDGSISTEQSITIEQDGAQVLIPTVYNGAHHTDEQAVQHYLQTGEHLGKFATDAAAERYAIDLHERQAEVYGAQPTGPTRRVAPTKTPVVTPPSGLIKTADPVAGRVPLPAGVVPQGASDALKQAVAAQAAQPALRGDQPNMKGRSTSVPVGMERRYVKTIDANGKVIGQHEELVTWPKAADVTPGKAASIKSPVLVGEDVTRRELPSMVINPATGWPVLFAAKPKADPVGGRSRYSELAVKFGLDPGETDWTVADTGLPGTKSNPNGALLPSPDPAVVKQLNDHSAMNSPYMTTVSGGLSNFLREYGRPRQFPVSPTVGENVYDPDVGWRVKPAKVSTQTVASQPKGAVALRPIVLTPVVAIPKKKTTVVSTKIVAPVPPPAVAPQPAGIPSVNGSPSYGDTSSSHSFDGSHFYSGNTPGAYYDSDSGWQVASTPSGKK